MNKTNESSLANKLMAFFEYLKFNDRSSALIRAIESDFNAALVKNDLKKLRQVEKVVHELLRETFSEEQRVEFAKKIESSGHSTATNPDLVAIDTILSSGKIRNPQDYELMMAYVNDYSQANPSNSTKIDMANEILFRYEFKSKK